MHTELSVIIPASIDVVGSYIVGANAKRMEWLVVFILEISRRAGQKSLWAEITGSVKVRRVLVNSVE